MCAVLNSNTRLVLVPEGTEASFSSSAFLTLSHKHTHTVPVKTAGGPSVPHTEAVTSWTGENVNRPSGAQFKTLLPR